MKPQGNLGEFRDRIHRYSHQRPAGLSQGGSVLLQLRQLAEAEGSPGAAEKHDEETLASGKLRQSAYGALGVG